MIRSYVKVKHPVCELFGKPVLDMECRLGVKERKTLCSKFGDLYFYDIRHDDECQGDWVQVQEYVLVNHWTTILSREPIESPKFIDDEDWSFTDQYMTISEYLEQNI